MESEGKNPIKEKAKLLKQFKFKEKGDRFTWSREKLMEFMTNQTNQI